MLGRAGAQPLAAAQLGPVRGYVKKPQSVRAKIASLMESPTVLRGDATAGGDPTAGQLKVLIADGPSALAMFDRELRYLAISTPWRLDYELGDRDVTGLYHYDVFPQVSEARRALHLRALAGEILRSDEERFDRPDGALRWVRSTIRPWVDSAGTIGGIVIATEDITARKIAEAELQRSKAILKAATENAGVAIALLDSRRRYVFANRLYAAIHDLADVAGQYATDVLAGVAYDGDLGAHLDRAFAGERVSYELSKPAGGGNTRYYTVNFEPLLNSAQKITHVVNVIYDITAPRQSGIRAAEAEERLRIANESAGIGTFDVDLITGSAYYSPELTAMFGVPHTRVVRLEHAFARIHRDDLHWVMEKYHAAQDPAGDGRVRMDFRFVRPGGEVRWMTWNGLVKFAGPPSARKPSRIVGACVEITDRKRAEEQLRGSEARYRGVVDGSMQGIIIQQNERIMYANAAMASIFGFDSPAELIGKSPFEDFVCVEERALLKARTAAVYRGEQLTPHPGWRGFRRDGSEIWVSAMAHKVEWQGRPAVVSFYLDITERKRAEERQQMLTRELDHRVKNTLARVLVILHRSTEGARSVGGLVEAIEGRIQSLAQAHSLLSQHTWRGAELTDLVIAELEPYASGKNTVIDGPKSMLAPEAAQAVILVLHELATNAAKYGALSVKDGRVFVSWRHERTTSHQAGAKPESVPELVIEWRETDGPRVEVPVRRGYGSSVIGELIPYELGGAVKVEFRPEGLFCRVSLPLSRATGRGRSHNLKPAGD